MNKKKGTKCIVKNEKFEVGFYLKRTPMPSNCVIADYDLPPVDYDKYQLVNGVIARIKFTWDDFRNISSSLLFTQNNCLLKEVEVENFQSYADHMNMFNEMSSKELEEMVLKAQEQTKTELEEDIENLRTRKKELEKQLEKYIKIAEKKIELDQLIKELNK
jgi:predicted ribosome quality control (RQC) complex YloA/Tae2 family protein